MIAGGKQGLGWPIGDRRDRGDERRRELERAVASLDSVAALPAGLGGVLEEGRRITAAGW
jgi:hypothetical protein